MFPLDTTVETQSLDCYEFVPTQYDGDSEPTPHQTSLQRHAPMRATVDGDARRNRRHSSDESVGGGSVTELDHSEYLRRYQQSTPMQPGRTSHDIATYPLHNTP